jgi:predicted amidophosphoribosyltransferase
MSNPRSVFRSFEQSFARSCAHALLDVVLPRECVVCSTPGRNLCATCAGALDALATRIDNARAPVPVAVGGPFASPLGAVIRSYKDGMRDLCSPLARTLAVSVTVALAEAEGTVVAGRSGEPVVLVPVPVTHRALWARGEDVLGRVVVLAARILAAQGRPVRVVRVLAPRRAVADQRHLNAAGRVRNVDGALAVRGQLPSGVLIVVDDVLTTGATLREAIRAIGAHGGRVSAGAVIAATSDVRP